MVLDGPTNALAHAIALAVGVAKLVGLVDHDQIPADGADLASMPAGKVDRRDGSRMGVEGVRAAPTFDLAVGLGVEHEDRQIELLLKLQPHCLRIEAGQMTNSFRLRSAQY